MGLEPDPNVDVLFCCNSCNFMLANFPQNSFRSTVKESTNTSMLCAKSVTTCSAQFAEWLTIQKSQNNNNGWQKLLVFVLSLTAYEEIIYVAHNVVQIECSFPMSMGHQLSM